MRPVRFFRLVARDGGNGFLGWRDVPGQGEIPWAVPAQGVDHEPALVVPEKFYQSG